MSTRRDPEVLEAEEIVEPEPLGEQAALIPAERPPLVALTATSAPAAGEVTSYHAIAAEIDQVLNFIGQRIPHLESKHPEAAGMIRSTRGVRPETLAAVAMAVRDLPELRVAPFGVDEATELAQYRDAFDPLVVKLGMLAENLKFSIEVRKARACMRAMSTYKVARGLARSPKGNPITHYVEMIRRTIRSGRKRKK